MPIANPSPAPPTFTRQQRLLLALVPPLATLLIRALGSTLRFQTIAEPHAQPADQTHAPDLYAFFHRSLLLAAFHYRHRRIAILISPSFDGELIARIVSRLGFTPIRGSSSRGGAAGLLALARCLARGQKVAITVDGPRGPLYQAKPGTAALAQREAITAQREAITAQREAITAQREAITAQRQAPFTKENPPTQPSETRQPGTISPFHLHPQRAWTLRSWDRFLLPKPFTRVQCAWPTPLHIAPDESIPAATARLQAALNHAVHLAEQPNSSKTP